MQLPVFLVIIACSLSAVAIAAPAPNPAPFGPSHPLTRATKALNNVFTAARETRASLKKAFATIYEKGAFAKPRENVALNQVVPLPSRNKVSAAPQKPLPIRPDQSKSNKYSAAEVLSSLQKIDKSKLPKHLTRAHDSDELTAKTMENLRSRDEIALSLKSTKRKNSFWARWQKADK